MNRFSIASFLDELEKIAVVGQVTKGPTVSKTPAATPAPAARLAPTPSAKAPNIGAIRSVSSVANRGAIRPGVDLGAQVRQPTPPKPITRVPQAKGVPFHSKVAPVRSNTAPARRPYNPLKMSWA